MPRARVPRTAGEFVALADRRGVEDVQRVFQCSRREAEAVVLQARRAVAMGDRYRVMEAPKGTAAVARSGRPPRIGHALTDAEVAELAERVNPAALKHLTAEERYAAQRAEQDRLRRERNAANGHPETDPRVLEHMRAEALRRPRS